MTKEKQQKPFNRRQAILNAAREIFEKKGFRGATTAEIAARAQVAEGTIFRYYKTKEDLLWALIDQVDTGQIAAFLHGAAQTDSTVPSASSSRTTWIPSPAPQKQKLS